jgi:hypothetical protein
MASAGLRIAGFLVLCSLVPAHAVEGQEGFERGRADCLGIPAGAYETGLLFNPAGYRTWFKRARCLQRLAVEWRDPELCSEVRQRRSLFFDGSAISEKACAEAVSSQLSEDRERIASTRIVDFHRLGQVRFARPDPGANHLLLHIETHGRHAGTYHVRVEAWPHDGAEPVVIAEYSQPLGTSDHSLTRSIPYERLSAVTGDQSTASNLRARVTLELLPRSHLDHFTLALIPIEARRSSVETRIQVLIRGRSVRSQLPNP